MKEIGNPYGLPALERGVFRDVAGFEGQISYRIVDSSSRVQAILIVSAEWDDDDIQRSCHKLLKSKDKRGHLKAI